MSTAANDSAALIGSVTDGRYRIEALLGEGAVGAVYRAVDVATGERVALKQWHAALLNDEVRGRFLREATALATLDHPNIVKVLGHGLVGSVPYVVLEYLEGQTLDALLSGDRPLEPELALELARQALSAIAYAHSHQVVHRDLKPDNIFVARDAHGATTVKIVDYGLAKFMAADAVLGSAGAPLTALGSIIGTPLYMPPEQAAGSSVDLAADVYSMGCVLFEMFTGRPPFLGDTRLELVTAHLREPIPSLSEALQDLQVAPELQALIDRALAKRQTERFPNAGAMLKALSELPASPIKPRLVAQASTPQPEIKSGESAPSSPARVWIACAMLAAVVFLLARAC